MRHRLSGMVESLRPYSKPAVLAQAIACTYSFSVIRQGVHALRLHPLIFHPSGPSLTPPQSTRCFCSSQHSVPSSSCSLRSYSISHCSSQRLPVYRLRSHRSYQNEMCTTSPHSSPPFYSPPRRKPPLSKTRSKTFGTAPALSTPAPTKAPPRNSQYSEAATSSSLQ